MKIWWYDKDRDAYEPMEYLGESCGVLTLLRATGQVIDEQIDNLLFVEQRVY